MPPNPLIGWIRSIRSQDLVWILLFTALGYTAPHRDIFDIGPLAALAVVQVLEPKIPGLESKRGRIFWIVLKLVLAYLFVGFTEGIESRHWLVMLVPVVSAATTLGVLGTLVFAILAASAYLSAVITAAQSSP